MKRLAAAMVLGAAISAAPLAHAAPPATQPSPQPAAQPSGPPNALQGFSQNRDKPIKITSATLEVRDKEKVATFQGDVHLIQGDTTLRSKTLVVFYEDESEAQSRASAQAQTQPAGKSAASPPPQLAAAPAAQGTSSMSQQIRRVEAKGGVLVTQKDQTATGDNGVFDMLANTVTLIGNVVIAQGPNVVKGDRLTVDLTSGTSRVECGKMPGQCRVQALIQPGTMKDPKDRAGGDTKRGSEAAPSPSPSPAREAPRQRALSPAAGLN
jgi:lipopolysaccharide export system protein LptA